MAFKKYKYDVTTCALRGEDYRWIKEKAVAKGLKLYGYVQYLVEEEKKRIARDRIKEKK